MTADNLLSHMLGRDSVHSLVHLRLRRREVASLLAARDSMASREVTLLRMPRRVVSMQSELFGLLSRMREASAGLQRSAGRADAPAVGKAIDAAAKEALRLVRPPPPPSPY